MTYQYSNFGVPDLALKRGLGDNQVIAPYATALAAMVDPAAAVRNFTWLEAAEGLGRYRFTRRSTTRRRGCPKGATSPSCTPTWRTIRA